MTTVADDQPTRDRNETELERCDRNLAELLQEVRVVQTGVQVLFGFLLAIVFQNRFKNITTFQKIDYRVVRGSINFQNPFRIDPYFDVTVEGRVSGGISAP